MMFECDSCGRMFKQDEVYLVVDTDFNVLDDKAHEFYICVECDEAIESEGE